MLTRRYHGEQRSQEALERIHVDQHESGKGHVFSGAVSPPSAAVGMVFCLLGATTVALKLHKYTALDGSCVSPGAAAVIAEDIVVFAVLFGLWKLLWLALFRAVGFVKARYSPPCQPRMNRATECLCKALQWLALLFLAVFILVFVGVEHLYFLSTRSLLDSDALLVAKKSLGPILFIALQVEGKRVLRIALVTVIVLVAAGIAAYKLRRAASRISRGDRKNSVSRYGRMKLFLVGWTTSVLLHLRAGLTSCAVFIFALVLVFGMEQQGDYRLQLLRRNCFIGVAEDVQSTPPSGGGDGWASAVFAAFSSRVVGGIEIKGGGNNTEVNTATSGTFQTRARNTDESPGSSGTKPNVVIVVLESTSGSFVKASNAAGVSPWAKKLAARGLSAPSFYSSMPNTNKAMFQVMCGMTPSLETAWVEFERPDILETVCLPGLLRSKLGYQSLFLTASMVGGLGCLGFDEAIGYAGEEEQGGRAAFKSRSVHTKFTFPHGTFEKVNYLGYDDHVVLNRSISFLLEEEEDASEHPRQNGAGSVDGDVRAAQELGREAEDAGKLLTILTVGPHHFHDVPEDFSPDDSESWVKPFSLLQRPGSEMEVMLGKYLAALRYQDLFLEHLYQQLDDTGLSKNTYVVVVGDHGEAFEEHGFNKHGSNVYQEGMSVPFFLTGPPGTARVPPGKILDRTGMLADIAPTVLDLLGLWKTEPERARDGNNAPHFVPPSSESDGVVHPHADLEADEARKKLDYRKPGLRASGRAGPKKTESGNSAVGVDLSLPAGSGIVGDSLIGPDYRSCALGATHYGGKTLAVVAGDWKGLFLYRWVKRGRSTHAEVVNAQLFDLSKDPREQHSLLEKGGGAGGCCPLKTPAAAAAAAVGARSNLSASCSSAAQISVPSPELKAEKGRFAEACCHLQNAATAFAGDNLLFFGRL